MEIGIITFTVCNFLSLILGFVVSELIQEMKCIKLKSMEEKDG